MNGSYITKSQLNETAITCEKKIKAHKTKQSNLRVVRQIKSRYKSCNTVPKNRAISRLNCLQKTGGQPTWEAPKQSHGKIFTKSRTTQLTFTCSKSTIETLETGVNYVDHVLLVFLLLTLNIFRTPFSSIPILHFEQINVSWVVITGKVMSNIALLQQLVATSIIFDRNSGGKTSKIK